MKTLLLTALLAFVFRVPAAVYASNSTLVSFNVTLYHIEDNQTYTRSLPAGYSNVGSEWQMVAGTYRLTFTPVNNVSYGPTRFSTNGGGTVRYNAVNTGSVIIDNVPLYVGGGNQISLSVP